MCRFGLPGESWARMFAAGVQNNSTEPDKGLGLRVWLRGLTPDPGRPTGPGLAGRRLPGRADCGCCGRAEIPGRARQEVAGFVDWHLIQATQLDQF